MERNFSFSIDSVSTIVGKNISADEWAQSVKVPDKKNPGRYLNGEDVTRITGVERKSWDPALFSDIGPIVQVAREAMKKANATVNDIDLVILVTSTPFWPMLNMDGFEILKALEFPDHIVPIQMMAGCAAMARAMQVLSQTDAKRPLIIAYEVSSPYMTSPIYFQNTAHPYRDSLWMSAALFADGAGAMVLSKNELLEGMCFYSRDSQSFGDGPGFEDALIHYYGGGAIVAPGKEDAEELAAYGMNGPATKRYYENGMKFNHQTFEKKYPNYLQEVKKIYMHQASPRLVELVRSALIEIAGAKSEQLPMNAHLYGNLVAPATIRLLDEDLESKQVKSGDKVCFSVVGAGPERGGFMTVLT